MDVRIESRTWKRFDRGKKVWSLDKNSVRGAVHITHSNHNRFFTLISVYYGCDEMSVVHADVIIVFWNPKTVWHPCQSEVLWFEFLNCDHSWIVVASFAHSLMSNPNENIWFGWMMQKHGVSMKTWNTIQFRLWTHNISFTSFHVDCNHFQWIEFVHKEWSSIWCGWIWNEHPILLHGFSVSSIHPHIQNICNLNRTTLICDVEMHLCQVNGHIMNEGHVKNWCFVVSKRGDVHETRVLRSFRNSMSCTLFCEWWTILCWSMRVVWNPKMDSALIWRWEVIIL